MKKYFISALSVACVIFSFNLLLAADTWTPKTDFYSVRADAVGFAIGSRGYVGLGADASTIWKDLWEYDPAAGTWTQKADFGGTARYAAVGFAIGGKGYVGTGFDGSVSLNDFWEYNPDTNAWTQKADFRGTARYGATGFAIGNRGYLGTGYDGTYCKDFWEYNPDTDAWTQKANLDLGTIIPYGRIYAVGFSIGTKGYAGLGFRQGLFSFTYQDFWEYDPAADTWTLKASLPEGSRLNAVGFSIGTKGYVGLGYQNLGTPVYYQDFWEYDPAADAWTRKADFGGDPRWAAVGFSISNKGYVGTGDSGAVLLKDFWEYDSGMNTVPDAFSFTDVTDAELSTSYESNAITVTGITAPAFISITGGEYSINDGAYTSADGTVSNGQTVKVRLTSSANYSMTRDATLTIGGVSDTFSVTTKAFTIGGGCFIATAAFGTPMARQVEVLRQFRDRYLLSWEAGRRFVAWYYRNGPVAARYIQDKPMLRAAVRLALYPVIGFCYLLLAGDLPLALGLFLLAGLLALRFRSEKIKIS